MEPFMEPPIVLTPDGERWEYFANTLAQRLGGSCDGTLKNTRSVLSDMYGVNVEETLAFFEAHGGGCDCEVLMNVAADHADEKEGMPWLDEWENRDQAAEALMFLAQWVTQCVLKELEKRQAQPIKPKDTHEPPEIHIRFNLLSKHTTQCVLCGEPYQVSLATTELCTPDDRPVCLNCGKTHAPQLAEMVEATMAQPTAQRKA